MGRLLAEEVRKHLPNNQPVVVINRPGAAQVVAQTELLRSRPDGYRIIMIGATGLTVQPHFGIAPFTHDSFTPIMRVAEQIHVFAVRADAPWRTFAELVEFARKNPRAIAYGSMGAGTTGHLAAEYWSRDLGFQMIHVPFSGSAEAMSALLGGHVDAAVMSGLAFDRTRIRLLVNQGTKKTSGVRDVPTFQELGHDYNFGPRFGLLAPPGTPPEVVAVIHDAFKKALENPAVVDRLDRMNIVPAYMSGEVWQNEISREFEINRGIMRKAGII
jgi:tripartite-type tricarboxylate transporter receptor subunit TctC